MEECMNSTIKRFTILVLLSGFLASGATAQSTIFVVRHTERVESGGNDPDLSELGRTRAATLANM